MYYFFLVFFAALTIILANPISDGTNGLSDVIIAENSNESDDLTFDTISSNSDLNDGTMKNTIISSSLPDAPIVAPDCNLDSYLEEPSDGSIQKRVNVCPATGITQPSRQPAIKRPVRVRKPSRNRSSGIENPTEPGKNPCEGDYIQPHYVTCGGSEFMNEVLSAPHIFQIPNCVPGGAKSIPLRSIFPAVNEKDVGRYCCKEFDNFPLYYVGYVCYRLTGHIRRELPQEDFNSEMRRLTKERNNRRNNEPGS